MNKILKKQPLRFFTLGIVVCMFSLGILMQSCTNEEELCGQNESLPYLSLPFNPADVDLRNFSEADSRTIGLALQRMEITKEDGEYQTKWSDGSEINISDELFAFFKKMLNDTNERANIEPAFPRMKNGSEEGTSSSYDCMAQSIAAIIKEFGGTASSSEIDSWIQKEYGNNGVPGYAFNTVASRYLKGSPVTITDGYSVSGKILIAVRLNSTTGHAGTLYMVSGNSVWYKDDQNGKDGFCNVSDIVYAYRVTGYR